MVYTGLLAASRLRAALMQCPKLVASHMCHSAVYRPYTRHNMLSGTKGAFAE